MREQDERGTILEERMYKVCRKEEESITHIIRKYEETKNQMKLEEFLNGDGKGWEVMKRIDRIREEKRKEELYREEERHNRS